MEELFKFVRELTELSKKTGMIISSWDCTPATVITNDKEVDIKYVRWDKKLDKYVISDYPTVKKVAL